MIDEVSVFYHSLFNCGQSFYNLLECLEFFTALGSSIHIMMLYRLLFLDTENKIFCQFVFHVCNLHAAY